MIANILLAGNLKTGKFISPHLVKYNERISINNNDITDEAFALVISAVKQAADSIVGICRTIEPEKDIADRYNSRYNTFKDIYPALKGVFEKM